MSKDEPRSDATTHRSVGGIPAPHRVTSRGWRFITSEKPLRGSTVAPASVAASLEGDYWDRVRSALSPGGAPKA